MDEDRRQRIYALANEMLLEEELELIRQSRISPPTVLILQFKDGWKKNRLELYSEYAHGIPAPLDVLAGEHV